MISIIIPAYNEEKYLPRLLDCIKNQTYKNYEIIVADANSKDRTRQIAKSWGCRIVKGGLPAVGRNHGAKIAKGERLLFLDADITLEKDFLNKALSELKQRNLQISGCYLIPDSNNIWDIVGHKILNIWFFAMQYVYPHMVGQCIFSTKAIHRKLKGFDATVLFAEDNDYVNRSRKFCRFRVLRSVRIISSTRRFENENRLALMIKYFLCPFHRMIFGEIRTNIFNYRLGSSDKGKGG